MGLVLRADGIQGFGVYLYDVWLADKGLAHTTWIGRVRDLRT